MYSLIVTAKMNDIDPQAWLADVLARLPGTTASRVPDLLPWNWQPQSAGARHDHGLCRMLTLTVTPRSARRSSTSAVLSAKR